MFRYVVVVVVAMESRGKRILKLLNINNLNLQTQDSNCTFNVGRKSTHGQICTATLSPQPAVRESSDEEYATSASEYIPSVSEPESDDEIDYHENDYNVRPVQHRAVLEKREAVKKRIFGVDKIICQKETDAQEKTKNKNCSEDGNNKEAYGEDIVTVHVTGDGVQVEGNLDNREKQKKKVFEPKLKTCRKIMRHPDQWKRQKSAILRQRGEEYISQKTGKTMPKKSVETGLLCKQNCRLNCTSKFSLEAREIILKKFYSLDINAKNSLLFKSIGIKPVARHRTNTTSQKEYSYTYSVTYDKKIIHVCRDAICSLHQIGRKKIEIVQNKLKAGQSAPSPDKRGHHLVRPHKLSEDVVNMIIDHIKQFPAEESHYSRNKNQYKKFLSPFLNVSQLHQLYTKQCIERKLDEKYLVKISMYRHIFETNFNLSFGIPKSDTCSVCDAGENTSEHQENFTFAFQRQKIDRQKPTIDKNICYITMDLQQTMPLPKLSTSKAFYLRQMWFYNFGIHCITHSGRRSYFFNWTEDVASRGSNEIASCLFRFCKLLKEENPDVDHLIVWSDSCGGQNKNFYILGLYQYLILNGFFKVVEHKFPEVGHSYLDSDRDFGRIEKVLRKQQNIFIPDQYRDLIKSASTKNSICLNMEHFFYNFEELPGKLNLFKKQTNTIKEKINLRDNVKWIRVEECGYYYYKTSLDDFTPFLQVDLKKKGVRDINQKGEIAPRKITEKIGGLSTEKMENLKEQIKFVYEDYRWFYEDILEKNEQNPKKKRRTC